MISAKIRLFKFGGGGGVLCSGGGTFRVAGGVLCSGGGTFRAVEGACCAVVAALFERWRGRAVQWWRHFSSCGGGTLERSFSSDGGVLLEWRRCALAEGDARIWEWEGLCHETSSTVRFNKNYHVVRSSLIVTESESNKKGKGEYGGSDG